MAAEKLDKEARLSNRTGDFEDALLSAVDEGLMVLGRDLRAIIYLQMEKLSYLKKIEIPYGPGEFSLAIQKFFGSSALVIEKLILRKLCDRLGVRYEQVED